MRREPVEPPRHVPGAAVGEDSVLLASGLGLHGPVACHAAGISCRQLDYWARAGLVTPSIRSAAGSGGQRLYSLRDVLLLAAVKRLADAGVSLQQVRVATTHLRGRGVQELAAVTLMSDGASVHECTSDEQVVELLRDGRAMFAIAMGGVWREVAATLRGLPVEWVKDSSCSTDLDDHISRRRPLLRAI